MVILNNQNDTDAFSESEKIPITLRINERTKSNSVFHVADSNIQTNEKKKSNSVFHVADSNQKKSKFRKKAKDNEDLARPKFPIKDNKACED